MWWILVVVSQLIVIAGGIQSERRAKLWSWSKFVFALAFAALEVIIVTVPLYLVDLHGRWFVSIMSIAGIVAALNFVWFIVIARRWKLPDGRTSLQAYRDEHDRH